jgi:hypothetical protein
MIKFRREVPQKLRIIRFAGACCDIVKTAAISWSVEPAFIAGNRPANNMVRPVLRTAHPRLDIPQTRNPLLGPGLYLVANGGSAPSVNAHAPFLDQSISRHSPYRAAGHGVNIVAIGGWGLRADGIMPREQHRYVIFRRAVVAPCGGEVINAVDGLPDLDVPNVDRSHLAGNHVILRCSTADILLGHFHKGSVLVHLGQRLAVGDAIAQVGNSGNTSEPHVHINAQDPKTLDAPFAGAPIPILISGRYLVRNDRFSVQESRTQP